MIECEELKSFTLDVNGLEEFKKRKDVFDFLRKQSGIIYFLQETHCESDMENVVRSQWGFKCIVAGRKGVREWQFYLRTTLSIKYIML